MRHGRSRVRAFPPALPSGDVFGIGGSPAPACEFYTAELAIELDFDWMLRVRRSTSDGVVQQDELINAGRIAAAVIATINAAIRARSSRSRTSSPSIVDPHECVRLEPVHHEQRQLACSTSSRRSGDDNFTGHHAYDIAHLFTGRESRGWHHRYRLASTRSAAPTSVRVTAATASSQKFGSLRRSRRTSRPTSWVTTGVPVPLPLQRHDAGRRRTR